MTRGDIKRLIAATTFACLLLLALGGWTWVVARTLDNERRVARSELEANQRRLLDRVAMELEEALRKGNEQIVRTFEAAGTAEKGYFAVLRQGLASGLIFAPADPLLPLRLPDLAKWRQADAAHLAKALQSGGLSWGLDEYGRDPVASLVAAVLDETPHPGLSALLHQRAMDDSVALKPSFRVFLLARGSSGDEFAARLALAETLRAMDGNAPEFPDAEVSQINASGRELRIYRTPGDLAALVGGFPEGMRLSSGEAAGGYVKRVAGLEKRPFLLFSGSPEWFGKTGRLLGVVGAVSGILVAALLVAGVAFGLREARTARSRMDLAASVAHELRTPLAGQRLVLENLANGQADENQRLEYIGMALRENRRLCHLAEEFLTFSRLERGGASQQRENVVVGEVLKSAVELMETRLRAGDFAFEIEDDLMISCDPEELSTVVRNLVENALKYSDGIPWVRLRARRQGSGVVVEVEDHGRGIARRDQARIFRQFHRGDRTLARRSDGIGLGLAIVRRIVEAHRGTIEVISKPGCGCLFRIHFPASS